MEDYKTINGFENYQINSLGMVKNVKRNTILQSYITKRGYYSVKLCNSEVKKSKNIHRLLGIYFLNNGVDGNFVVDHKDNNPLNNSLDNLQIISKRLNSTKDRVNSCGENCVYPSKNKFRVRIKINGVRKNFGSFSTIQDAANKRDEVLSLLDNYKTA
jgi:hypothetical protein